MEIIAKRGYGGATKSAVNPNAAIAPIIHTRPIYETLPAINELRKNNRIKKSDICYGMQSRIDFFR